jgi:ribulose-5-phosphate 4-epimerase/fuculose-1-phosphate aldolase
MDASEAGARRELVRYCRLVWERRLTSGSSGNLSVDLNDVDLLVTPTGSSLGSLQELDLVRIARDGTPRNLAQRPTSELPLHLTAYAARRDIRCVMHTHPTFCVVWSKTGAIFPRDTVGAMESMRNCAWTPYLKNATHELADLCAAEFSRGIDIVLMERHGLTVVSSSLEDAFVQSELAEEAARIAYYSRLIGV